jgi:hypothetical protein
VKKKSLQERVLARALAEELRGIQAGSGDPTVVTQGPVRRDITDKNNGDVPAT